MITITNKEKPKWYQFRWVISNWFVNIGRKIYPQNPEVKAFYLQLLHDQAILGQSVVRINPLDIIKEK